jgi:hypothetical protein
MRSVSGKFETDGTIERRPAMLGSGIANCLLLVAGRLFRRSGTGPDCC